ncbi:hypothetical protein PJP08_29420, partial [Mycobacterium kansasii]
MTKIFPLQPYAFPALFARTVVNALSGRFWLCMKGSGFRVAPEAADFSVRAILIATTSAELILGWVAIF